MPSTDEVVYFNGINGASGDFGLAPLAAADVAAWALQQAPPANLAELQARWTTTGAQHLGTKEGVDPQNLAQAGWGVIFAHGADPALKEALSELLAWRRAQAGERFRIYEGAGATGGVRAGERKGLFLARNGVMPGPADPTAMPYYLLLVGDPAAIPFDFQYELDVQYAVGRLHFATLDEYASYARSVVAAEKGAVTCARRASFFGVSHPGDEATRLSATHLIKPLSQAVQSRSRDWDVDVNLHAAAHKARLAELLAGPQPPALLVAAAHGLEFPLGDACQLSHQGALLCADWPGPAAWTPGKRLTPDTYFSADDVTAHANLHGTIALLFACHAAGTPLLDDYGVRPGTVPKALTAQPFVASLPQRMLGHAGGGALAVIGHVARASSYSFGWPGVGAQITVFQSCLERLLNGYPVGAAVEFFNERWAELATMLHGLQPQIDAGKPVPPAELAGLWLAAADARGYIVLGDPAVRLPPTQPKAEAPQSSSRALWTAASDVIGSAARETATAKLSPARPDIGADLNRVVVTTYATVDPAQPTTPVLKARTVVLLTGEVEVFLPETLTAADEPYLAMHRATVQEALAARLAYLKLLTQSNAPDDAASADHTGEV